MKKFTILLVVMSFFVNIGLSQGWGKGMLVKAGTTVTEESGTTIYIHGGADWTLLLEDNTSSSPSFLMDGVVKVDAGSDSVRFQQYLTKDAWHYVSAAVAPEFNETYYWNYLYRFLENTREWEMLNLLQGQPLTPGRGFAAWNPTNGGSWPTPGDSIEQIGLPRNTSVDNYALSYAFSGAASSMGWNLIGNPFTVALDWNGHGDWDLNNVDATIYCVDQDDFSGGGNGYETYNWNTGMSTNGADSIIAAGQGFFVHANAVGARLDFPTSQRFHRPNKELTKKSNNDPENLLRMAIIQGDSQNEIIIGFDKNTQEGNDPMYDAYHMGLSTSIAEIYAVEGDSHYAHYWCPSIENHEVVPVNFEPRTNGTYSLDFSNVDSFDSEIPVWLEDIKTGVWQDLKENSVYAFSGTTDDDIARFNVHFDSPNDVEEVDVNSFASIYSFEKEIHINIPIENFNGQAYVYNLLGEEVLVENITSQDNTITMNVDDTYFIVKLVGTDEVMTKKVYIH